MAGPVRGVPGLGHRRAGRGAAAAGGARRSGHHACRAHREVAVDDRDGPAHRRRRARPGPRRRAGARLGGAAGGRARGRQVDAAAGGRGPLRPRRATAPCTSPARSPPPRCALRADRDRRGRPTSCTSLPRPTWPPCSGHVEQVAPRPARRRLRADGRVAEVDGAAGGVTQVREVAGALIRAAKNRGIATVARRARDQGRLDRRARGCSSTSSTSCCTFEGDRHSRLRLVRARQEPLRPGRRGRLLRAGRRTASRAARPERAVPVPARRPRLAGTCVTVTLEGRRPLLAEVQALVVPSSVRQPAPRRPAGSTRRASRWCSAVLAAAAGCTARTGRHLRRRRSAASASPSPRPTSRRPRRGSATAGTPVPPG